MTAFQYIEVIRLQILAFHKDDYDLQREVLFEKNQPTQLYAFLFATKLSKFTKK